MVDFTLHRMESWWRVQTEDGALILLATDEGGALAAARAAGHQPTAASPHWLPHYRTTADLDEAVEILRRLDGILDRLRGGTAEPDTGFLQQK